MTTSPSAPSSESASPRPFEFDSLSRPHDERAEQAVLGAMILDDQIIPEVARILKPDDFYEKRHQVTYTRLIELHEGGKQIGLTLLADLLRRKGELDSAGGPLYLASLENAAIGSGAAPENAEMVRDKATQRRLMEAASIILKNAAQEKLDVPDQIENAEKLIFEIGEQVHSSQFMSVEALMKSTLEELMTLYQEKKPREGLRTHMREVDRIIGSFDRSALIILAARPSMGKTAFALNLVRNVARVGGQAVGFFSLEMGAEELNMRLLCSEARVSSHTVRQGKFSEEEWARLREKSAEMMDLPIYIDDTAALTLLQLRSRARRLRAQRPDLGLIVVDYLQLMRSPGKRSDQNRQQEVAEISRGLKALAKELRVPVLALSQLSRNIEQRSGKREAARPMLSDLRESGSIEQDADVVLFVHRERKELEKDEDGRRTHRKEAIPTEIIVGKNRNGPIATADMYFIPEFTLFGDPLDQ